MIANQNELYTLIESILKPEGYIKKKDCWYLDSQECICFFTLGKSPYGNQYENAMGCFLKDLKIIEIPYPEYYKNDLKFGIENLLDKDMVKRIFDLENTEFNDNRRELLIREIMYKNVIPFLKNVSTKEGIIESIKKYPELRNMAKVRLKEFLGIE